jgi:hypothetical protein
MLVTTLHLLWSPGWEVKDGYWNNHTSVAILLLLASAVMLKGLPVSACLYFNLRVLGEFDILHLQVLNLCQFIRGRLRAWAYLFDGPNIVQHAFQQV